MDRCRERCHQLVMESEPAGQPVLSGRKSKNVLAQTKPPCILIYCISMGACLPACLRGKANFQRTFTQNQQHQSFFPFPSQKGDVVIQKMTCQMTMELPRPVIWESFPRSMPLRESSRSQHASTSPPAPCASSLHAWRHQ